MRFQIACQGTGGRHLSTIQRPAYKLAVLHFRRKFVLQVLSPEVLHLEVTWVFWFSVTQSLKSGSQFLEPFLVPESASQPMG